MTIIAALLALLLDLTGVQAPAHPELDETREFQIKCWQIGDNLYDCRGG